MGGPDLGKPECPRLPWTLSVLEPLQGQEGPLQPGLTPSPTYWHALQCRESQLLRASVFCSRLRHTQALVSVGLRSPFPGHPHGRLGQRAA